MKKYQEIADKYYPRNGNLIHYYIKQNYIGKTRLAETLGINKTTLTKYFKNDSLQFGIIWRISKALNHNFVAEMSEYMQIPYDTQTIKKLRTELAEQAAYIAKLEAQIEVLKQK